MPVTIDGNSNAARGGTNRLDVNNQSQKTPSQDKASAHESRNHIGNHGTFSAVHSLTNRNASVTSDNSPRGDTRKLGANGLPRRRNGKMQACEPCRKAKSACDHSLPVCERCVKRRFREKCVYVDQPMTREKEDESDVNDSQGLSGQGLGKRRRPDVEGDVSRETSVRDRRESVEIRRRENKRRGSLVGDDSNEEPVPESGPFIKSGGFFGPTNFSAVFLENEENLRGGDSPAKISTSPAECYNPSTDSLLQSQAFLMISEPQKETGKASLSPRIALGAKVLNALPDRASCMLLLKKYRDKGFQTVYPTEVVFETLESLYITFPVMALKIPRNVAALEAASVVLCANAEKPLEEKEDYKSWMNSVTGPNMRWELVGQVYGALAAAILSLGEENKYFQGTEKTPRKSRKRFAVEMKECVEACVTLSSYVDLINLPMVALLVRNLVLQTVIYGDTSLVVWRQLGDLIFATTALGLHRQPDSDSQPVTYLSEMKRRLLACIFYFNLTTALLMGRPPALTQRSIRYRLPSIVSDEALMEGGDRVKEELARLDENGWNRDGELNQATTMRARAMTSPALSEILELHLGEASDSSAEKVHTLLHQVQETYASFPPYLHYNPSDFAHVPAITFWRRLTLRLSVLEHRLLLERLAHKRQLLSGQSMISCACEMLSLTVFIWVQRDRWPEWHHDYDWMLMCFGVPSSGVLCVELLKEMKGTSQLKVPRSETVQNLSLLVGFFEWVKPQAGNYWLCMRMRIIVKSILDRILNGGVGEVRGGGKVTGRGEEGSSAEGVVRAVAENGQSQYHHGNQTAYQHDATTMVENMGTSTAACNFSGSLDFAEFPESDNFDWLNEVDWSRGPLIDLGVGGGGGGGAGGVANGFGAGMSGGDGYNIGNNNGMMWT